MKDIPSNADKPRKTSYWESMVNKYEKRNKDLEQKEAALLDRIKVLETMTPAIMLFNMWRTMQSHPNEDIQDLLMKKINEKDPAGANFKSGSPSISKANGDKTETLGTRPGTRQYSSEMQSRDTPQHNQKENTRYTEDPNMSRHSKMGRQDKYGRPDTPPSRDHTKPQSKQDTEARHKLGTREARNRFALTSDWETAKTCEWEEAKMKRLRSMSTERETMNIPQVPCDTKVYYENRQHMPKYRNQTDSKSETSFAYGNMKPELKPETKEELAKYICPDYYYEDEQPDIEEKIQILQSERESILSQKQQLERKVRALEEQLSSLRDVVDCNQDSLNSYDNFY